MENFLLMTEKDSKKILVVDDSSTMRMLLCMTIKHVLPGISVTEAVDGVDAQEKFKTRSFDVIITDIVMPNMGGFDLVRWIHVDQSFQGFWSSEASFGETGGRCDFNGP